MASPHPTYDEHRYRLVIDNLKEVVFQTDAEGRWTFLNPAWAEITGFSVEESLGRNFLEYVHPEDRQSHLESYLPLLARMKDYVRHEVRYLTRTGYCWMEVYARLTLAEDGTLLGTSGTLNDVTERRRAGDELARRERYLTGLVELQQRLLAVSAPEHLNEGLLEPLGRASGASGVYLFESWRCKQGELWVRQSSAWSAPGALPRPVGPWLADFPLERRLPRWYEVLSRGECIAGLLEELPEEEQELLRRTGALSVLVLPLRMQGALAGFVALEHSSQAREWDRLEVDMLSAAAGALSLAMEHHQAELALRERDKRFRQIAENASDVLYHYQLAGSRGFTYVSSSVAAKLGYTPEEHYRNPLLWHERVHPVDRPLLERLLSEGQGPQGAPVVLRFLSRQERTVWLQHVVAPVLDSTGGVVAMEGVARDITERRQAEEALKLSEARFRILLEGVPDAAAIQREGRILYANPALVQALGFERPEELLGHQLEEFLVPQEEPAPPAPERGPELLTGEHRLKRKDGRQRVAEFASLPLPFDGQLAVVSIARDVTEQRQLQARLTLADRLASMGTLAAGIAHEINNPLAFVMTNLGFLSEELRRGVEPPPEGAARVALTGKLREWRTVLAEAREGAERVRQIVRQLKTFSRPDEQQLGPVDLHGVLDSAATLAANEIRHRARLVRDYGQVPWVVGNEGRLCQVMLNLLVNAAQAMPEGAADRHEIRLVTRMHASGRVQAEVQDNGVGIPPEVLGRIFDPFFTTKPVGVGTGLGLSICHGIVTSLGGEIQVESEVGQGTTVRVLLRASERGARRAEPERVVAAEQEASRGRVLVVDDEPAVGRALRRILREHEVELATSGRQALARLREDGGFHAILCDVMMPDLAGKDLYEAVQQAGSGLEQRFVFVSGGAFTPGARDFLARVPNPMLEKPFDEAMVRRVVQELVQAPRVELQARER